MRPVRNIILDGFGESGTTFDCTPEITGRVASASFRLGPRANVGTLARYSIRRYEMLREENKRAWNREFSLLIRKTLAISDNCRLTSWEVKKNQVMPECLFVKRRYYRSLRSNVVNYGKMCLRIVSSSSFEIYISYISQNNLDGPTEWGVARRNHRGQNKKNVRYSQKHTHGAEAKRFCDERTNDRPWTSKRKINLWSVTLLLSKTGITCISAQTQVSRVSRARDDDITVQYYRQKS